LRTHNDFSNGREQASKKLEAEKYTELTSLLKTKVIAEYIATLQKE